MSDIQTLIRFRNAVEAFSYAAWTMRHIVDNAKADHERRNSEKDLRTKNMANVSKATRDAVEKQHDASRAEAVKAMHAGLATARTRCDAARVEVYKAAEQALRIFGRERQGATSVYRYMLDVNRGADPDINDVLATLLNLELWLEFKKDKSDGNQSGRKQSRVPMVENESESEKAIIMTLQQCGKRMTASSLIGKALGKEADGHAKGVLSGMVKRGSINNKQDVRPKGYGLPEWG